MTKEASPTGPDMSVMTHTASKTPSSSWSASPTQSKSESNSRSHSHSFSTRSDGQLPPEVPSHSRSPTVSPVPSLSKSVSPSAKETRSSPTDSVSVTLPDSYPDDYILNIEILENSDFPVIEITLTDSAGNLISDLDGLALLCFNNSNSVSGRDLSDACLSYFNYVTREWECVDECLKQRSDSVW